MAQIDRHAPGTFCWVELGTTDQDGAKHLGVLADPQGAVFALFSPVK